MTGMHESSPDSPTALPPVAALSSFKWLRNADLPRLLDLALEGHRDVSQDVIRARFGFDAPVTVIGDPRHEAGAGPRVVAVHGEYQVTETVEDWASLEPTHAVGHVGVGAEDAVHAGAHHGPHEVAGPLHGHLHVLAAAVVADQHEVVLLFRPAELLL